MVHLPGISISLDFVEKALSTYELQMIKIFLIDLIIYLIFNNF